MNKPISVKPFRLGRMESVEKPPIQVLSPPANSFQFSYAEELKRIQALSYKAQKTDTAIVSAVQASPAVGSLVMWAPTGKPGLWRVTNNDGGRFAEYGMMDVDYSAIEHSIAAQMYAHDATPVNQNPCGETKLAERGKKALEKVFDKERRTAKPWRTKRGYVRLEWIGGWAGYAGDGQPVRVKTDDVRVVTNEMEALAIAAL